MIPKNALNNDEAKKELDKTKEIEKNVDREKLFYKTNEYTYNFRNLQTIKTFGKDIYDGTITLKEAKDYQNDLLMEIINFKKKTKPRSLEKKQEKDDVLENLYNLFKGREKILNAFESKIFSIKSEGSSLLNTVHSKLKILTPKQMLHRLPMALAQVKVGNNSKNLLNQIRQIVYSLYQSKEITKKVYNNIIKSIQ